MERYTFDRVVNNSWHGTPLSWHFSIKDRGQEIASTRDAIVAQRICDALNQLDLLMCPRSETPT